VQPIREEYALGRDCYVNHGLAWEAGDYDGGVAALARPFWALALCSAIAGAQSYFPPAGNRPPSRRPGAAVLPGGRVIAPTGEQYSTGAGAFGLAVSASGRTVVTTNLGPGTPSITALERSNGWEARQLPAAPSWPGEPADDNVWRSVSLGVAFSGERTVFVSEGNSGRVAAIDLTSGERRRAIDLNLNGYRDSFTGELAWDAPRSILYAADQANFRVVAIDTRSRQILASVRVGRLPFAMALSPDRRKLYVSNAGIFQYQALALPISFPPFGFPSREASAGVDLQTERGLVHVPALGDPNAPESNSVAVIDVSEPAAPKVEAFVRTGQAFGAGSNAGSSPSGIVATTDRVYVSNAGNDSITVIDARTNRREREIPILIPGLEELRGVLPIGLAYEPGTGWLLVAEAGINAIGVIDARAGRVLGHIPAGWYPARVAVDRGTVFVANLRGGGSRPSAAIPSGAPRVLPAAAEEGSISIYPLPAADALAGLTNFAMQASGFERHPETPRAVPSGIRYVVLLAKANRSFDEVLGDVASPANGRVMAAPELARFGSDGYADGRRELLSLHGVDLTPNQHTIARRWAFSDNFYSDAGSGALGHHWLTGAYPNAWSELSARAAQGGGKEFRIGPAPGRLEFAGMSSAILPEDLVESGTLWSHLSRHGLSFINFGGGLGFAGAASDERSLAGRLFLTNMPLLEPPFSVTSPNYPGAGAKTSDTDRALRFIDAIDQRFVRTGADLPHLVYLLLPNDQPQEPRRPDYPYAESFLLDNDYAVGRVMEYLSGTKWWKEMAVFITEEGAAGGADHIDAHRTLLLCAGPWAKSGYVTHTNTSFPGLLKTIFEILGAPPLTLFDAAAAGVSDCFRPVPDFAPYRVAPVDRRIYEPPAARSEERR